MPGFLSPRKAMPLLLIPEYSGINKGQRVPDRSKRAHRKPFVKCFLTIYVLKEPVLVLLIFAIVSFVAFSVISALIFMIYFLLLFWVFFPFFFQLFYCQEAFNKRLPACCFGSVRNPLACLSPGWGIQAFLITVISTLFLFMSHMVKGDCLQLSLIGIVLCFVSLEF